MPSDVVAAGQMTASAAIMAVAIGLGASGIAAASPGTWGSVAALGLLSTALAYILYFNLIASSGATNASLVTLVVPVSAVLLGVLFLGEGLNAYELAGMALIGLGLVTIDGRIFRSRTRRTAESAGKR
jgi:drug/metabolite transporter (DMT)-like permease